MSAPKRYVWPEQMEKDLVRLYAPMPGTPNYLRISEIAMELNRTYPNAGVTRNAVVAKATRMGLNKKYPRASVMQFGHNGPKMRMVRPRGPAQKAQSIERKAKAVASQQPKPEPPYEPTANNVPYLDACDHQCMWPVGMAEGRVTIVCGNQRCSKGGYSRPSPYCAHHATMSFGGNQVLRSNKKEYRRRPAPRFS